MGVCASKLIILASSLSMDSTDFFVLTTRHVKRHNDEQNLTRVAPPDPTLPELTPSNSSSSSTFKLENFKNDTKNYIMNSKILQMKSKYLQMKWKNYKTMCVYVL